MKNLNFSYMKNLKNISTGKKMVENIVRNHYNSKTNNFEKGAMDEFIILEIDCLVLLLYRIWKLC